MIKMVFLWIEVEQFGTKLLVFRVIIFLEAFQRFYFSVENPKIISLKSSCLIRFWRANLFVLERKKSESDCSYFWSVLCLVWL